MVELLIHFESRVDITFLLIRCRLQEKEESGTQRFGLKNINISLIDRVKDVGWSVVGGIKKEKFNLRHSA